MWQFSQQHWVITLTYGDDPDDCGQMIFNNILYLLYKLSNLKDGTFFEKFNVKAIKPP